MSDWSMLDTWIALTAALAAMSCALPGTLLLLRRQSLLGDALSHAALPGLVLAFVLLHEAQDHGWISRGASRTSSGRTSAIASRAGSISA